jgi:hypothetical protein
MTSTVPNRPTQHRARAQEDRDRAASEPDEAKRLSLLHNAEMWEQMADFEEKNPSHNFQSYYPEGLRPAPQIRTLPTLHAATAFTICTWIAMFGAFWRLSVS